MANRSFSRSLWRTGHNWSTCTMSDRGIHRSNASLNQVRVQFVQIDRIYEPLPGKITINGRSVAVNGDFAKQALFISQHLECSERYAAGLLQDVMTHNPNFTPERCIEAAIMEYHTRRRELADCLGTILQAAERAETGDASPLHQRIDMFVRQQLLHPGGVAGAGLSLAMKLFQEIHSVGNTLAKALTARQNAKSETVAPTQGQSLYAPFRAHV